MLYKLSALVNNNLEREPLAFVATADFLKAIPLGRYAFTSHLEGWLNFAWIHRKTDSK